MPLCVRARVDQRADWWQTGRMPKRDRKRLIQSEPSVSVEQIAYEAGVREEDVAALISSGALPGGLFDPDDKPVGLLAVRSLSQYAFLALGAESESAHKL